MAPNWEGVVSSLQINYKACVERLNSACLLPSKFAVHCNYHSFCDNLSEIRVEYNYYNKNHVTPIFITSDDLLSLTFNEFYGLVLK